MKLAPVLAKYLAANKVLNLPGLGTFHADNSYDPDGDYSKRAAPPLNISFEQKKITSLDDGLIQFVSQETGKMKVLSESDLKSQLDGAIDFLNTGKPYFITGIGTLTKKFDGSFEFHKEKFPHTEKEKKKPFPKTEKNVVPQTYIDSSHKPRKTKPALILTVLVLLAVAVTAWLYINSTKKDNGIEEEVSTTTEALADSSSTATTVAAPTSAANTSSSYKYILEITQQPRASKRYSQLKKINWPVEMETADSLNYKLFINLPKANADTVRIKDSLSALSGRKVWIEQ